MIELDTYHKLNWALHNAPFCLDLSSSVWNRILYFSFIIDNLSVVLICLKTLVFFDAGPHRRSHKQTQTDTNTRTHFSTRLGDTLFQWLYQLYRNPSIPSLVSPCFALSFRTGLWNSGPRNRHMVIHLRRWCPNFWSIRVYIFLTLKSRVSNIF